MRTTLTFLIAALLGMQAQAPALAVERAEIPQKYQWNLADLYPGEPAWAADKQALVDAIPAFAQRQGKLGGSAAGLLDALRTHDRMGQQAYRLYSYAFQRYDEDTRVGRSLQMKQEMSQVYSDFQSATAFIRPELLALGAAQIERFVAEEPRLGEYRMFFDDILRAAPHTLSAGEEKIIARMSALGETGATVHSVFTSAELPFPEVVLSTGDKVRLDTAGYEKHRASPVKADRDAVFKAFWDRYGDFTGTLATTLNAHVLSQVTSKNLRNFDSSLDAALFESNIPRQVYEQLLQDVNANLPTLHRYLKLRRKIMGLERLGYEDLYAPIVADTKLQYTPEQAMALTLDAFAPLGPTYIENLRRNYTEGWIDFMPSTGKSSGAYSNAIYGVHPYQLLNFNGNWEDVSALAHETGHSMHAYLAHANQPYTTAHAATFVAEVASTLNETLLVRHVLDITDDDRTRLFLLSSYLDVLRATLFRQAQFAEFELRIHEAVERGEPLTGESLNKLYLELVRKYYGHDAGVVDVDERYAAEWAYVPHFYRSFYVYQYATSMVGGMSLAEGIIGDAAVQSGEARRNRDAYLRLLSAGSSQYPIELLKEAGVDMTTPAPFDAAIRQMNAVLDEMERIYARLAGSPGARG